MLSSDTLLQWKEEMLKDCFLKSFVETFFGLEFNFLFVPKKLAFSFSQISGNFPRFSKREIFLRFSKAEVFSKIFDMQFSSASFWCNFCVENVI